MTEQKPPTDSRDFYQTGKTTVFAYSDDPRFSYCLYLPSRQNLDVSMPLMVLIHGTERDNRRYRDLYTDFASEYNYAILAPLFPAGIIDPEDLHNYKFLEYRGIRFDEILIGIVEEVGRRFGLATENWLLHGFSGGGQFVQRFVYLYPNLVRAASIGAPGHITRLEPTLPWWLGTGGVEKIFERRVDIEGLRKTPIQMVVGEDDVETWEINNPGDSNWKDGVELTGRTRIDRIHTLRDDFERNGIPVRLDIVPGVAHDETGVSGMVKDFFVDVIRTREGITHG